MCFSLVSLAKNDGRRRKRAARAGQESGPSTSLAGERYTLLGACFAFCSPTIALLALYFFSPTLKQAVGMWFLFLFALCPPTLLTGILALTPANVRAVRCASKFYQLSLVVTVPAGIIAFLALHIHMQCGQRGSLTCAATLVAVVSFLCYCIGTAAALQMRVNQRSAGVPSLFSAAGCRLIRQQVAAFDATHGRGTRWALLVGVPWIMLMPTFWLAGVDGYYKYPTRKALSHLWRVVRVANFALAILTIIVASMLAAAGEAASGDATVNPICLSTFGGSFLLSLLVITPANRRRVHAAIGRLGTTLEEQRAAAVAALVSRADAPDLNALTVDSFRVLPFECLREEDFSSSADSGLNRHAVSVALGDCDAFLSHSWHDDGPEKWAALRSWADGFERATGRPPKVWLDKGCIDQKNIDASLAALPLYLAGCDRLVVVAGPTYASRLWCVIEIFTFLFMGGSRERIDVLPIGDDTMTQVKQRAL